MARYGTTIIRGNTYGPGRQVRAVPESSMTAVFVAKTWWVNGKGREPESR